MILSFDHYICNVLWLVIDTVLLSGTNASKCDLHAYIKF